MRPPLARSLVFLLLALVASGSACAHRMRSDDARLQRTPTTALVYEIGRDTLRITLLRPDGAPETIRHPIRADSLAALVAAYRREVGADVDPPSHTTTDSAHAAALAAAARGNVAEARVAAILLPPALRARLPESGELVVAPSGALWLVPFAALPVEGDAPLGIRLALRYASSLSDLIAIDRTPVSDARADLAALRQALVIGDPAVSGTIDGETPRVPLPAAGREAAWVAARLGALALTGAAADEATVRARLPHAPLAHLATHGISEEDGEATSFLALAPGGGEDGRLAAREVMALPRLTADLVVLSACRTAPGDAMGDDDAPALQRAFLARGARSVLASAWSVSDEATEALMRAFYAHWLDDADRPSKAEALRRAQAELRRTPGLADPLYWAAFQLLGAR